MSEHNMDFAWLIEADGTWWNGRSLDAGSFTKDYHAAMRFCRQEDADTVKHWLLATFAFALRTTQHGFAK